MADARNFHRSMESMRRTPVDDLLGFRFAPRIRDLADKRIYVLEKGSAYPALAGLVGGTLNVRLIATHWNEILRLASSINQGTVTASLILRKLGAYPRQNSLALALGAGSPGKDLIHTAMASKP
jgi:TnpA family transposase